MTALTVVMHDGADTPANRSVRELLRWLGRPGDRGPGQTPSIRLVAAEGGPLLADLSTIGDVFVVNDDRTGRISGALQAARLHRPAEVARSVELRRRVGGSHDVVWLADLRAARLLSWTGPTRRVVAHQHANAPSAALGGDTCSMLTATVDTWIAGDDHAAADLAATFPGSERARIHPDLMMTARLWSDGPALALAARRDRTRQALRERYGIPTNGALVVGGGPVDFWSATNAFAQTSWEVRRRTSRPVQFVWLTEASTDRMVWPLRHDIAHAGLDADVHVVGDDIPALEVLLAADVHLRTGRNPLDPFEVAELATAGTPVVAFDAPTIPAGLRRRATTVGWLDVPALGDAVAGLLNADADAEYDDDDLDARDRAGTARGSTDDRCGWDVRVGGPDLMTTLVGPTP